MLKNGHGPIELLASSEAARRWSLKTPLRTIKAAYLLINYTPINFDTKAQMQPGYENFNSSCTQ